LFKNYGKRVFTYFFRLSFISDKHTRGKNLMTIAPSTKKRCFCLIFLVTITRLVD